MYDNEYYINAPRHAWFVCFDIDIDECSEESHNCLNASDCVDTDGGHYCPSGTTMEPTTDYETTGSISYTDITPSSITMEPTTDHETTGSISRIDITSSSTTMEPTMEPTNETTELISSADITSSITTMEPTTDYETTGSISSTDITSSSTTMEPTNETTGSIHAISSADIVGVYTNHYAYLMVVISLCNFMIV